MFHDTIRVLISRRGCCSGREETGKRKRERMGEWACRRRYGEGQRRTATDGAGDWQRWTGRRKNEGKERRAWAEGIASVWRFYKATGKRKKERKREEENEGGKGRPAVWWR